METSPVAARTWSGRFRFSGAYDVKTGRVLMVKQYLGKHSVRYYWRARWGREHPGNVGDHDRVRRSERYVSAPSRAPQTDRR